MRCVPWDVKECLYTKEGHQHQGFRLASWIPRPQPHRSRLEINEGHSGKAAAEDHHPIKDHNQ